MYAIAIILINIGIRDDLKANSNAYTHTEQTSCTTINVWFLLTLHVDSGGGEREQFMHYKCACIIENECTLSAYGIIADSPNVIRNNFVL